MTSSWLSEPPLTPMRTGLPLSTATLQMVENCSSRRCACADVAGIDAVLVEGAGAVGIFGEQDVAVVVEVADERRVAAGVEQALLDFGNGGGGFGNVDGDADEFGAGLGEFEALLARWRRRRRCRCWSSTGRRPARRRRPGLCRP